MRIAHLTFSMSGGAGRVAVALANSQASLGHQSRVISLLEYGLKENWNKFPTLSIAAGLDNFVFAKKNKKTLVTLARSKQSQIGLLQDLDLAQVDVLNFHWIEGVTTLPQISEILKGWSGRIFWTLHDMRPFTGACHYSHNCENYKSDCGNCPILRKPFRNLSKEDINVRERILKSLEISFIAPSVWMFKKAEESRLLAQERITLIENPINPLFLNWEPSKDERSGSLFIAADLDDKIKGFAEIQELAIKHPELKLSAIGKKASRQETNGARYLGKLTPSETATALRSAEYLIVNSLAENAPLVIAEAAASGVVPILPRGLKSCVSTGLQPYCLYFDNPSEIPKLQSQTDKSTLKTLSLELREAARHVHSPEQIARRYLDIYT